MRNRMYGGVRGRKTKVGEKLLRFPPTRLYLCISINCFIFQLKLKNLFEIFGEFNYSLYFCEYNLNMCENGTE